MDHVPTISTPIGLFGDDEDISALFAAKPPAVDCAGKKGLCHCVFCPVFVVCVKIHK